MIADERQRQRTRLRPYVVRSVLLHAVVAVGAVVMLASGQREARRSGQQLIDEVRAVEDQQRRREQEARRETVEEQLAEQLQAEMEQLMADQLAEADQAALKEMTAEDIREQISELAASDAFDLAELTDEQFYEMLEQLRTEAFEDLRRNLDQLKRDMLVAQVRSFIRTDVTPEIKARIEDRLKHDVGKHVDGQVARQAQSDKHQRGGDLREELIAQSREFGAIKREQDTVTRHAERREFDPAAETAAELRRRESEAAEKVNEVLDRVAAELPAMAETIAEHRQPSDTAEREAARAMEQAGAALADARESEQSRTRFADRDGADAERKAEAERLADATRKTAAERSAGAAKSLADRAAELDALAREVDRTRRDGTPDAIQREIADRSLESIEESARERVTKEVAETAVPRAADRLMEALAKDLEQRDLDTEEFREFLQADIRKALSEEAASRPPDAAPTILKAAERFQLRDAEALEEARKEVAEAAEKLRALARRQDEVRKEADGDSDVIAQREYGLPAPIEEARRRADQAVAKARLKTVEHDRTAAGTARRINEVKAADRATEAARAVEQNDPETAREAMADVSRDLDEAASAMEELEKGLAAEVEAVREVAREKVDLEKALGRERAEQAVAEVTEAAEKAAEQRIRPVVEHAVRSVDMRRPLEGGPQSESLARADALDRKLDQIAANTAEGRGLGEAMSTGAGLMMGPGQGSGLGLLPGENLPWTVRGAMSRYNRSAYEEFMKDMRDRMNPDNYYDEAEATEGPRSLARHVPDERPAAIVIDESDAEQAEPVAGDAGERSVPDPEFPHLAFGVAPMMQQEITIDGDLSDWGELDHGLRMQYSARDTETKIDDGPTIYVRWSPDGLYFGYTVRDANGIQPCEEHPWSGDGLEVMLDMSNSRMEEAYKNPYAQKFCFTPFGCRGSTDVKVWEMGRGLRGLGMAHDYPDTKGIKGTCAGKIIPGSGYSVEVFLSRRAIVHPRFVPGKYVALNFSVNLSSDSADSFQWSASQGIQTWRRPDTWGDLLLLGSDAELRFTAVGGSPDHELDGIVPGEPVGLEIRDADMNLNTLRTDRVAAEVVAADSGLRMFVVLEETGPDTGLFRGSVDTQQHFKPMRENVLNVRSGSALQLVYNDARTAYGEKDRKVSAGMPVGWPVLTVGGR